ncbi:Formate--tetrahydrofolate ligase [Bienertia sinuspersici]
MQVQQNKTQPQRSNNNNNYNSNNTSNDQRNVYETKALHFISKAINGDYSLTDFTINENTSIGSPLIGGGNSSPYNQPTKQSGLQLQENKAPKRSGILKPSASPSRNFRDPTPFKPKERNTEIRVDPAQKSISGQTILEESNSGTKRQPNKLSENIMKCLILIYVRLIRISRQNELEKSGPISRSMYSSLSFRTEPGVSLSTSLMKESKQQDPYGIFEIEGAIPRDIGPYKNLVVFSSSCLDPKYVSNSSSIPLFQKLKGLYSSLQKVDLRSLTDHQKLAFWINIYNACIMHGFLKFSVPSTPEKLLNLLNKATLNVGGKVVNAQAIERCILRKPTMLSSKDGNKEAIIHQLYGLQTVNPNVIFTLCCGTRSSPAIRIYTGEGVTSELEKSKLEYLQASISVNNSKKIWLPELLIQNMNDFAKDLDSLLEWVCHQLPTSGSLRKSIVDCFRGNTNTNSGRVSNAVNIEKMPYDFEFQYLLQV